MASTRPQQEIRQSTFLMEGPNFMLKTMRKMQKTRPQQEIRQSTLVEGAKKEKEKKKIIEKGGS